MLTEPNEILEFNDGETKELRIISWQNDEMVVRPARAPRGEVVKAMRLHVSKETKDHSPYYWDTTAKTLIHQLLPHLEAGNYHEKTFVITAHGTGPQKRFSLEVR